MASCDFGFDDLYREVLLPLVDPGKL